MSIWLPDEAATVALANSLRALLPPDVTGWTVLLEGPLGAGKSTLARALIRGLGHDGPVPSPTYTLVEPYELPGARIYHIDLYRVVSVDELRFLGLDELEDGLAIVEWPDRAPDLVAEADIRVSLTIAGDGRDACIEALSARARPIEADMEALYTR